MARELMKQHGISPPYLFHFDKATLRFGHHDGRKRIISVSRALTLVNGEDEVRDTLLHEIAHAIVFLRHGPRQYHGAVWKRVAAEIGARPTARYTDADTIAVAARWTVSCPNCGKIVHYHIRKRRIRLACKVCCSRFNNGKWDERFVFIWERNLPDFV